MEWQEGSDGYDMVRRKGGKSGEVVGKRRKLKTKVPTPFSFISLLNRGNYTPSRWRSR